jgi:hypothetical protein
VGVVHRPGHPDEQPQALLNRQAPGPAVLRDGHAVHVLHHQVRPAVVRGPGVQEPGDIGVVQGGQDLALHREPLQEIVRVQPPAEHLQGNGRLLRSLGPLRQVDRPRTSTAQGVDDAVGPDAGLGGEGGVPALQTMGQLPGKLRLHLQARLLQEVVHPLAPP